MHTQQINKKWSLSFRRKYRKCIIESCKHLFSIRKSRLSVWRSGMYKHAATFDQNIDVKSDASHRCTETVPCNFQSINQLVCLIGDKRPYPMSKSVSQTANKSTHQPTNQKIYLSINQSINHYVLKGRDLKQLTEIFVVFCHFYFLPVTFISQDIALMYGIWYCRDMRLWN